MKSFLCAFAILLVGTASAKTTFKYGMKKGDVLRYKSVSANDVATSRMGQEMNFSFSGTGTVHAQIEEASSNGFTLTAAMDDYSLTINAPDAGQGDTTIPVTPVVGKRVRQVMTPQGHELSSAEVDSVQIDDPMLQQFASGAGRQLHVLMELPGNPIAVGDTWEIARKDTQSAEGNTMISDTKRTFTYVRDVDTLGHKCAFVAYDIAMSQQGSVQMQGMEGSVTSDGKGKGAAYFDYAAGLLIANASTIEMNQQVSLAGQSSALATTTTTSKNSSVIQP